jgi:hypothetical protein
MTFEKPREFLSVVFLYPGLSVMTATPIGANSHPMEVASNQNTVASSDTKPSSLKVAAAADDEAASDCC